jgi:hypothetical protein
VKVGDLIRWNGPNVLSAHQLGKYGIVVGCRGVFFDILWMDGTRNGNVEWQMEVVSESG